MTDGQKDKWTDGQTEFPLVDSTPERDRVKNSHKLVVDMNMDIKEYLHKSPIIQKTGTVKKMAPSNCVMLHCMFCRNSRCWWPIFYLFFSSFSFSSFAASNSKRRGEMQKDVDENPTYGDYFDPNPRMEVEDTNVYYSSDYEAGTGRSRATDNNPYNESKTLPEAQRTHGLTP